METAHLTSVEAHGTGWEASCLCGWRETLYKPVFPKRTVKDSAKMAAWNHWASFSTVTNLLQEGPE